MAEKSYLWTTSSVGDGTNTYTRADTSMFCKVLAGVHDDEGVAPGLLNALAGSVPGANTVRINTGGALVDGKPYLNDSTVDVNIPSAVGGGNTRIDRIVLRAYWTAQTVRIHRIAGTDAASPTAPAVTQDPGNVYDLPLYQALVNTSGVVTLTDERKLGQVGTAGLEDGAVTASKLGSQAVETTSIKDGAVTAGKIADGAITASKLATGARQFTINVPIGNGQEVVSAGFHGYYRLPQYPFKILSWEIGPDVSGSIQFDLWVDSYAAFPPTAADSICGSAKPTLSNAAKASGSASGWSGGGQVAGNRWLGVNVVSASSVKFVTLALICEG